MRPACAAALLGAAALVAGGCQSSAPASPQARPCLGLTPPRVLAITPLELPATFAAARLSAELPAEVVIGPDGSVRQAAMRTTAIAVLAPFAEETLKRARFDAGSFEGNPTSVRAPVRIAIGGPRPSAQPPIPEVWAYVAAGESREARWQLRDSVSRVTVVAHVPRLAAPGAVVAVAPDGQTKSLVALAASESPQEINQTVATGKFFARAGEYRLELRGADVLSTARFTIADDSKNAVISACETVSVARKTGPGN